MLFISNNSGKEVLGTNEVVITAESTVCISGHRENHVVPFEGDPANLDLTITALKLLLGHYIDTVMDSGKCTLMAGLAEGTDLWAAEHALKRKRYKNGTKLISVIPFYKHASRFSRRNLELLQEVELYSDLLLSTCGNTEAEYYSGGKGSDLYKFRNYYMVNNSSAVVSFYDSGSKRSGTSQTLRRALKQGKPVYRFGSADVYDVIRRAGPKKMDMYYEISKTKPKPIPPAELKALL